MGDSEDGGGTDRRRRHVVSRRPLLGGGVVGAAGLVLGGAGVELGILPGRSWLARQLGLNGPPGVLPDAEPGRLISGTFESVARLGMTCGWTIAYPPQGGTHLPVLVVLHGRDSDHTSAFGDYRGLQLFLAQAVSDGAAPFAIASVDGGDTYWHRRASGEDAGAMVIQEFLPLLQRRGLETSAVGLLGWSMGGYGVLRLAGLLGASRVGAVTALSPALWHDSGDTAPGAFDDPADFAANTVFGHQADLAGIPLRIDCGTGDPFYAATEDYVESLSPRPAGGFQPGDHDIDYWRRMAPQQLSFIAQHLPGRR